MKEIIKNLRELQNKICSHICDEVMDGGSWPNDEEVCKLITELSKTPVKEVNRIEHAQHELGSLRIFEVEFDGDDNKYLIYTR